MATVAEMIEWMKTLPQDAEVECGIEVASGYERYMTMVDVDIESCTVYDYKDEKYKDYPHIFGKVVVQICGE